jgi:hypothetical protein
VTTTSTQPPTEEQEAGDGVEPFFPNAEAFVGQFWVSTFTRPGRGRWCAQWWGHAEALVVLQSLWQTWESARIEPGAAGIANWLTTYAYPLARELNAEGGPFAACTPERHETTVPWPSTPSPEGFWPDNW